MVDTFEIKEQIFQFFRSRWIAHLDRDGPLQGPQPMSCIFYEENEALTYPISIVEVQAAFWSLREDKVPRLDGFPPLFFYRYWTIIGREVVEAVQEVFESKGLSEDWKKMLSPSFRRDLTLWPWGTLD